MKRFIPFIIAVFLISSIVNAQQDEEYKIRTAFYESLLDVLFDTKDLSLFESTISRLNYEKIPGKSDAELYIYEYVMSGGERFIFVYSYPSGKVVRVIIMHKTDIFNFVQSYLKRNAIYHKEQNAWVNYSRDYMITYKIEDSDIALLDVMDLNFDW